jgi:SAM-dependent methyltransferase
MAATGAAETKAGRWGRLWGARADEWALTEEQQIPTYEAALDRLGVKAGDRVLEVGCGSGVFLRAAVARGASVTGVDSSERLVELAGSRAPEADVRVGEMEALAFGDDTFDVVAGFNAFFFASDMVAALREAGRVARPGGSVVIQVWGEHGTCDLDAIKPIVRPYFPGFDPSAPPPPDLAQPGALEGLAAAAGLKPAEAFDVSWAYVFADDEALTRSLLSAGGVGDAAGEREPEVRKALIDILEPFRTTDGGYRLENTWHFLIARARGAV